MKYWLIQLVVTIILCIAGNATRYSDWYPLIFGVILAVYGTSYCYIDYKRREARDQKEYDKWVKEMNTRCDTTDW